GMAYQHSLSSWKYLSRDIPVVRRLFLMMKTGIEWYLGMTTGRITPGLVKTRWSPSSRTQRNPSFSKTHLRTLKETGLIAGMEPGQRERDRFSRDEPGALQLLFAADIARLFQDL